MDDMVQKDNLDKDRKYLERKRGTRKNVTEDIVPTLDNKMSINKTTILTYPGWIFNSVYCL